MKIAICCNAAGGVLDPGDGGGIGGMQVRAYVFARALCEGRGHEVRFVIPSGHLNRRYTKGAIEVVELPYADEHKRNMRIGEDVLAHVEPMQRFPWLRIHRWSLGLPRHLALAGVRQLALSRDVRLGYSRRLAREVGGIEADVMCCFKPGAHMADAVVGCRRSGRPTVMMIANDVDLGDHVYRGSQEAGPKGERGHACWRSIAEADEVVVQTRWQQRRLKDRFGREGVLIRNPIDMSVRSEDEPPINQTYVLWIGRGDTHHKRPRICFEIARKCKHVHFVMVMNPMTEIQQEQLKAEAPENVRIIDRVPYEKVEAYFKHAAAFVSTSAFEGFPNTFLQAGKYAVPIVSLTVDPDGIVAEGGCGIVCDDDVHRMGQVLNDLMNDASRRRHLGDAAYRYVAEHHGRKGRVRELELLLEGVVEVRASNREDASQAIPETD